jgi:hypothetical protein
MEAVMAQFKVLSGNMPGGVEEKPHNASVWIVECLS